MLRVVFAGTPQFAYPSLAALVDSPHEVALVLTQPDRRQGRGRRLMPSVIKAYAETQQLSIYQPATLHDSTVRDYLAAVPCDVLVVVAYGLMIPKWLLSKPRYGCINVHPSLLPRWRGAAPIPHALLAGDQETGVCIIRLTQQLDAGDILGRMHYSIQPSDNSATLHAHLAQEGAALLLSVLDRLEQGTCSQTPQAQEGITYAPKLAKSDAKLDWSQPAVQLCRAVRAYNPWPVAYTYYYGEPLKIWQAGVVPCDVLVEPGTLVSSGPNGIIIKAGQAALSLFELQRPGRRRCTASEFFNAEQRRLKTGSTRLV